MNKFIASVALSSMLVVSSIGVASAMGLIPNDRLHYRDKDRDDHGSYFRGAPGPIEGAGIPATLIVLSAAYFIGRKGKRLLEKSAS